VKPRNETVIKVIDFGSSCYDHQKGTLYVGCYAPLLIGGALSDAFV